MKALAVIPARFGSSRFPGKPLACIGDKTLIQHTYENTCRCGAFNAVTVATDDPRIFDHVRRFGGQAVMTSSLCPTGTDRVAEVVRDHAAYRSFDIVVNVQGDHPCISPETLQAVIRLLSENDEAPIATAAAPLEPENAHQTSVVKCVLDQRGMALYFSRGLLPFGHGGKVIPGVSYYRHIGLYAFRKDFVLQYTQLPATPLQLAEDLEQLKVLEHGYRMKVAVVNESALSVDVPEDINSIKPYLCLQNISLSPEALSLRLERD